MSFSGSFLAAALAEQANAISGTLPDVNRISTDSRDILSGSLFVPIVGERFDGHDFVDTALANGAVVVVSERPHADARVVQVKDTLRAYQDIAAAHLQRRDPFSIALSGSNGKTTVKEMMSVMFKRAFGSDKVHATTGNLNNHIGVPRTALELEHQTHAIFEMGMNHFGELERLCAIVKPDVGVLTNIGIAHAGNLGGRDGVEKAKDELFAGTESGGTLVVNGEDARCRRTASRHSHVQHLLVGTGADCQLRFRIAHQGTDHLQLSFDYDGTSAMARLPTVGKHNAENAAVALGALLAAGGTLEHGVAALEEYQGVPGRLSVSTMSSGLLVIDDSYNANPDSAEKGLLALNDVAGNRRAIAALGPMLELGVDENELHRKIGRFAADRVAMLFSCGELGKQILDGAKAAGLNESQCIWAEDSEALALVVAAEAKADDVILVKGSRGAKMENIVQGLR